MVTPSSQCDAGNHLEKMITPITWHDFQKTMQSETKSHCFIDSK